MTTSPVQRASRMPWAPDRRHSSIRFWLFLTVLETVALGILIGAALVMAGRADGVVSTVMWAWLLMPLGAVYGMYLGIRRGAPDESPLSRSVGVACNMMHLIAGLLLVLLVRAGLSV